MAGRLWSRVCRYLTFPFTGSVCASIGPRGCGESDGITILGHTPDYVVWLVPVSGPSIISQ